MEIPERVTHYYLPTRRPFQNLSDLEDNEAHAVMRELNSLRGTGSHKRQFGRVYLEWRRLTEARLRRPFEAAGGRPERATPHYFCLGRSSWFEGLAVGMRSVSVPVTELPAVAARFGLGSSDTPSSYDGYEHRLVDSYVEVQLWADVDRYSVAGPTPPG